MFEFYSPPKVIQKRSPPSPITPVSGGLYPASNNMGKLYVKYDFYRRLRTTEGEARTQRTSLGEKLAESSVGALHRQAAD